MADVFKPLLAKLADGATLDDDDAQAFFGACLRGEPTPAQIAAAVTAMRLRGETVGEIAACAGAQGPGESRIASGRRASASSAVRASLRWTTGSAPSSAR